MGMRIHMWCLRWQYKSKSLVLCILKGFIVHACVSQYIMFLYNPPWPYEIWPGVALMNQLNKPKIALSWGTRMCGLEKSNNKTWHHNVFMQYMTWHLDKCLFSTWEFDLEEFNTFSTHTAQPGHDVHFPKASSTEYCFPGETFISSIIYTNLTYTTTKQIRSSTLILPEGFK